MCRKLTARCDVNYTVSPLTYYTLVSITFGLHVSLHGKRETAKYWEDAGWAQIGSWALKHADVGWAASNPMNRISCSLWIGVAATARFSTRERRAKHKAMSATSLFQTYKMHLFSCITVNMATCCYLENVAALLRSFFLCLIRYKSFSCLDIKLRPHLPILHTAVNRVDKIKHDENNNVMRIARYKKHTWFDSCSSSWVKQTFSRSHDTGRNLHLQGFWLWTSSDVLQLLFSCWTEKKTQTQCFGNLQSYQVNCVCRISGNAKCAGACQHVWVFGKIFSTSSCSLLFVSASPACGRICMIFPWKP